VSSDVAYDQLVGRLDYPMAIVTTAAGDDRAGCLVGFWTQCSIDPPRHLVCISDKNHTCRVLERGADAMVVHVVPADSAELAELFGGETGDDADKFARCEWAPGPEALPVLEECRSWFAARIVDRVRLGDHVGYVVEPFEARAEYDGDLYTLSRGKGIDPGHEA
jgi:flavin reductase (DIM6/NTAB) family NADH-FMN oxidoreductase RutF